MKLRRIEILTSDIKEFQQIALLIDREDLLQDIEQARKDLGIVNTLPIEYKKRIDRLRRKQWRLITKLTQEEENDLKRFEDMTTNLEMYRKAEELGYKYKNNDAPIFVESIKQAILFGAVFKGALYRSWSWQTVNEDDGVRVYSGVRVKNPDITISISKYTTKKQFIDLYNEINKYEYIKKLPDTIPNIERDRDWYWEYKSGKSYPDIQKSYKKTIGKQGVFEAIKQYKERLSTTLKSSNTP
jgi:hypothetical protein